MNRSDLRAVLFGCILIVLMLIGKATRAQDTTPQYIKGFGIKHSKIVYAQLMLESGNMKCTNCSWSNYNNPFGFHNGKRYLKYDNLEHALEGYKEWQEWRCKDCVTDQDYYKCLIKYWGAPKMEEYVKKLKNFVVN